MTEEIVIEEEAEIIPEIEDADVDQEKETDTPNEIESLAAEIGWRADGDLDAKEFILKSREIQDTMRTHIRDQKGKFEELNESVAELKVHNERVFNVQVANLEKELSTLKKEKKEAIEEGDADRVEEIETEMDGVKEAMIKPEAPKPTAEANPDFDEWIDKNPWYKDDPEMATYADKIGNANPDAPYKRVLALVERKVKEMYPDKFTNPKSPAPSPVEGAVRRSATPKFTKADLTGNQRSIMSQFVRQGIMTEKQYIADIQKTQGA